MNNFEKIKQMSIEEMAEYLFKHDFSEKRQKVMIEATQNDYSWKEYLNYGKNIFKQWLESESEE